MSSNQRPQVNVGAGSLREADEDKFTVNEGWSFFQQYLPDNSVIDSEDFSYNLSGIDGNGPYIVSIPAMPECFLDPSSLRLRGTCRIKHVKNNAKQEALPKRTTTVVDPFREKEFYMTQKTLTDTQKKAEAGKTSKALVDAKILPVVNVDIYTDPTAPKFKGDFFEFHYDNHKNPITDQTKVVPINLMCQAMWKDVEIKLNSNTVTRNTNLEYAMKAYLETVLTYGNDALDTHLQAEMWCPDDLEDIKSADYLTKYNEKKSFERKRKKFANNNDFSFVMQLHTEFNSINGFIVDNMPYTFTFVRNDPKFFLRTNSTDTGCDGGEYTVDFSELKLTGKFMKPSAEVLKAYRTWLAREEEAVYQTTRTDIRTDQMLKGQKSHDWNNIFASDNLPDMIYVCMVDADAKNGDYGKDPYHFDHFGVSNIYMRVNNKTFPLEPLKPNWTGDNYLRTYKHLYENCSVKLNNIGLSITPERFKHGTTIFAWDLNHDNCGGAHANHSELKGSASLHMVFDKPNGLDKNATVIVAGVYRDYLAIDVWRRPNVLTSYGVAKLYQERGLPPPKFPQ